MPEYAVYADNREALKACVRTFPWRQHGAPALKIVMSCCGMSRTYRRDLDIPVNDVGPCPCGNWLIKYKEQPLRVAW